MSQIKEMHGSLADNRARRLPVKRFQRLCLY